MTKTEANRGLKSSVLLWLKVYENGRGGGIDSLIICFLLVDFPILCDGIGLTDGTYHYV